MEYIVASGLTMPVIHHFTSPAVEKDQLILRAGSEVRVGLQVTRDPGRWRVVHVYGEAVHPPHVQRAHESIDHLARTQPQ